MIFSDSDLTALYLTLKLASIVTLILLFIGTPIAWWLTTTRSRLKGFVAALVALPLVLPPSVLGFYLLLAMAPDGFIGQLTNALQLGSLAFSFWGLVFASVIYSLPFVVQPIHNAMGAVNQRQLEVASTLGASRWDRFFSLVIPLSKNGFITATILGFVHTMGEFGVVLMIGGNIPGETQVLSVQIYQHVEALDYDQANGLAATMVVFSFVVLFVIYALLGKKPPQGIKYAR